MKLYHGSILEVKFPDVKIGRANLDFGRGFYLTDIEEQAVRWAKRMSVQNQEPAVLNIYEFDKTEVKAKFRYIKFDNYDKAWLNFIVANRQGHNAAEKYDVVEGGVANDRVIDTVETFIAGLIPEEFALQQLSLHRPNNQICILNQEVVEKYLKFIQSTKLE